MTKLGNLTSILVFVLVVMGWKLYKQDQELEQLKAKTSSSMTPVDSARTIPAVSMQEQGECARQAAIAFRQAGYQAGNAAEFENHYKAALRRCFVMINNTEVSKGTPIVSKNLSDAFEGKVYGSYIWINSEHKQFWEVKPMECYVDDAKGERKDCSSEQGFESLAEEYMKD